MNRRKPIREVWGIYSHMMCSYIHLHFFLNSLFYNLFKMQKCVFYDRFNWLLVYFSCILKTSMYHRSHIFVIFIISIVSYFMVGRDGSQLSYRWLSVLDPSLKKGPWSKEEDQVWNIITFSHLIRFLTLFKKYGIWFE